MSYWEDRVTQDQHGKISAELEAFQSSKKKHDRDYQHSVYDVLTNNGMTSEEADEMINLLLENA